MHHGVGLCGSQHNPRLPPEQCGHADASLSEKFKKPVLFDECACEGNIPYNWGNITGQELLHGFWTTSVLGGYATHGETFLSDEEALRFFGPDAGKEDAQDPILWWAKGGTLHGKVPERIAYLKKFMLSLPGDPEPDPLYDAMDQEKLFAGMQNPAKAAQIPEAMRQVARLPKEQFAGFLDGNRPRAGHVGDGVFLQYFAHNCPCITTFFLPEGGTYEIRVIYTWEMTEQTVRKDAAGQTPVLLPGKEGILAVAFRKDSGETKRDRPAMTFCACRGTG